MVFLLLLLLALLVPPSLCDPRAPPLCGSPFPLSSENLDFFESLINGSITSDQGSSDMLSMQGNGGPREWPRNDQNKVVIQYCYEFSHVRDEIGVQFREEGIGEWMRALGGEASSATGHGLVFEETVDENGQPLFCYDASTGQWNAQIDYNTVMVKWSYEPHFTGGASTGFFGFFSGGPPMPGIHAISFGEDWIYPTMVHELGHILGMAHEHQRKDRDDWIEYRCHNVQDFYQIFDAFKAQDPSVGWNDLCDNMANALRWKFLGAQMVREWSAGEPRERSGRYLTWKVADYGEPYDIDSVMHYPSVAMVGYGLDCLRGLTAGCTMVRNGHGHKNEYMPLNVRPSRKDVEWVKKTYPWMDPPSGAQIAGTDQTVS